MLINEFVEVLSHRMAGTVRWNMQRKYNWIDNGPTFQTTHYGRTFSYEGFINKKHIIVDVRQFRALTLSFYDKVYFERDHLEHEIATFAADHECFMYTEYSETVTIKVKNSHPDYQHEIRKPGLRHIGTIGCSNECLRTARAFFSSHETPISNLSYTNSLVCLDTDSVLFPITALRMAETALSDLC